MCDIITNTERLEQMRNEIQSLQATIDILQLYWKRCIKCGLSWEDVDNSIPCPRCYANHLDEHMKICLNCGLKWEEDFASVCPFCYNKKIRKVKDQVQPMTLERAVEILNERLHQNTNYSICGDKVWSRESGEGKLCKTLNRYSNFEAIAIAEKYEREGK